MSKVVDLTGRQVGRWRVIGFSHINPVTRNAQWECECQCGVRRVVAGRSLQYGDSKSCGCHKLEWAASNGKKNYRHGHGGYGSKMSPTYKTHSMMKQRCLNPKAKSFEHYGGRGIKVCDRWLKFANFLADMGERPPGMTLDRYPNNDGNYEPGNCRWATPKEQRHNQRPRRRVKHGAV